MRGRIVVVISVWLVVLSNICFSMTLSQPVKLGEVFNTPSGGFIFRGESANDGKSYTNHRWSKKEKVYEKGVAIFGCGENALYVHYDDNKEYNVMFGSKNVENTYNINRHMIEEQYNIDLIKTDTRLLLYILTNYTPGGQNYTIIGRREDGVIVKYFSTNDIKGWYFQNPKYVHFSEIHTSGDIIVISYKYFYPKNEYNGELRFKWDGKAQWFGVEHVVY